MRIDDLLRARKKPFVSFEFFPPANDAALKDFYVAVDRLQACSPLFTSVTYGAGGGKQEKTLSVVRELASMGLCVMSHLTCVNARVQGLAEYLDKLQEAGVHNVLALRGDPPKDVVWTWEGPFRHAADLVRYIRLQAPDMGIGVAGYPHPHPESQSFADDRAYTLRKLEFGAGFVVTQLFFDVREYFELVEWLRRHGCNCPVIPGVMPIQSLSSLKRVLSLCGASIPGKLFLELEEADRRSNEDVAKICLDFSVDLISRLLIGGAPGIHLYTLNKADLCSRIVRECGLDK